MRNRPHHDWILERTSQRADESSPSRRLLLLYFVTLIPLLAVAVRTIYLQSVLQPKFIKPFTQLREVTEEIPAREGRILAADGTVLADDLVEYDVLMHYRWLEEPADRRWLLRKAWERMSRAERRQSALVSSREQEVLNQRRQMQQEVCRLTGRTKSDFVSAAREIQVRVEKIWESVHQRRLSATSEVSIASETPAMGGPIWLRLWREFLIHLQTPPERPSNDPLVIVEQEDYHVLWPDVPEHVASYIQAHPQKFPGVKTRMRTRRYYPYRDVAAHILGARTPVRAEESDELDERDSGNSVRKGRVGRSGIERIYNERLSGQPGQRVFLMNRHGEVIESRDRIPERHGQDVVLTLDLTLQQRAEQLLDQALLTENQPGDDASPVSPVETTAPPGGCIVAIDVHTGAVLAAATAPRFDANLLISADSAAWAAVAADPRKPFFPRLTHMAIPPGSVFKTLTAVALLETGAAHSQESMHCRGYLTQPDQHRCLIFRHYGVGHGDMNVSAALCESCNVYFFAGARRMGGASLVDWSHRFGFGQQTGIDLPHEGAGHLPEPAAARDGESAPRWRMSDTLGLSIGQSSLTATPLQMARMMAAIANNGYLVTPHLATSGGPTRLEDASQIRPVFAHPEPQAIPGLSPETLRAVREGLYRVVHDPAGTGYKTVRCDQVTIAGKTGTAEAGQGRPDHAWFAGYTPADQPRIAFAVVLEHGGSGSHAAGPLARELVKNLLDLGLINGETAVAGR